MVSKTINKTIIIFFNEKKKRNELCSLFHLFKFSFLKKKTEKTKFVKEMKRSEKLIEKIKDKGVSERAKYSHEIKEFQRREVIFEKFDTDKSGEIDHDEFVN